METIYGMTAQFFTNKEGNPLLMKFEGMFKLMDVEYFDVQVMEKRNAQGL
jgi:protein involved in ribonucleotide reduction